MRTSTVRSRVVLASVAALLAVSAASAQMDWRMVFPTAGPPYREGGTALAYDAARQEVLLFGGSIGYTLFADTWGWDGTRWTQYNPAQQPPARNGHAMAYDAARQQVVLYGGSYFSPTFDTWTWDGKNWNLMSPSLTPPPRYGHTMVHDAARRRVLMFGGCYSTNAQGDTWEWDGQTWTELKPLVSPPARYRHAMAYDDVRRRVVVFGGWGTNGALFDTWEWDGVNWTECTPKDSPPYAYGLTMAYDAARQRIVLLGSKWTGTWEWDGRNWTEFVPITPPPGPQAGPMAYDSTRGCVVFPDYYLSHPGIVYEYAPVDLVPSVSTVSVATGGSVQFSLDAGSRRAGKNYWILGCHDSPARGITAGKDITLLLAVDSYFLITLLHPNTFIAGSAGALDPTGKATATLHLPPGLPAALIGSRFYHAYVVFRSNIDYAATPVPLTLVQ
jgi:hypothetical protein